MVSFLASQPLSALQIDTLDPAVPLWGARLSMTIERWLKRLIHYLPTHVAPCVVAEGAHSVGSTGSY